MQPNTACHSRLDLPLKASSDDAMYFAKKSYERVLASWAHSLFLLEREQRVRRCKSAKKAA